MADDPTPPEGGKGDEFAPITSQEDFDKALAKRLDRERSKFSDYDDLKAKAEKFDAAEQANLSELEKERKAREAAEAKAQQYEQREQVKTWARDITKGSDVPAEALRGSTKEELEEHFELLKPHFTKTPARRTATPPGKPADEKPGSRSVQALRALSGNA